MSATVLDNSKINLPQKIYLWPICFKMGPYETPKMLMFSFLINLGTLI